MSPSDVPRRVRIGLGLVALSLAGLLLPARYEGSVVVPISPGHGLSLVDGLSLVPLLVGSGLVYWELWRRRGRLLAYAAAAPARWSVAVFGFGCGLGLLLASGFSSFWWWWAIGAAIVAASVLAVVGIAARPRRGG